MTQVILIDGKNALYRHQHAHNFFSREDGFPTGALYGCLNSMLGLHHHLPEAAIVWCWDGAGETWRHKYMMNMPQLDSEFPEQEEDAFEVLESDFSPESIARASMQFLGITDPPIEKSKRPRKPGYKGNRTRPTSPDGKTFPTEPAARALLQIPILKLVLQEIGIRSYEIPALECDDLIGMLTKKIIDLDKHSEVFIHSGDRDYYQLLAHSQVTIITNMKDGKLNKVKPKNVLAEHGVKPKNWAKYRALTGDGSDNIPHLFKIGPVRAKAMLSIGLDPSLEKFEDVPDEATKEFEKFFPYGMSNMWPALHGNYKLCQLVTCPMDECLSDEVKSKLAPMFEHFDSVKRFFRSKSKNNEDSFRKIGMLLASYALASVSARRQELWEIP